jgi:hypothetical protein
MEELVIAKILTPKKDGSEVNYLNDDLIRILPKIIIFDINFL